MDPNLWLGVQKALHEFSKQYNILTKILSFGLADKYRRKLAEKTRETDKVIELGCGPGVLVNYIKFKEYIGLDPLKSMIKIAKLTNHKPNVKFVLGYAEKIPFPNKTFDTAICSFSFRDFIDKEKAIKEIHRVLKERGRLLILDIPGGDRAHKVTISLFYMVSGLLLTLTLLDKRYLTLKDFVGSIWKMPSLKEIKRKLLETGFKKVKIDQHFMGYVFILEAQK